MKRKQIAAFMITGTLLCSPVLTIAGGIRAYAGVNQFAGEEWYYQISTVEVNREPAHATFMPYESAEKALEYEKTALDDKDERDSAYYQSLNGTWKFKYAEKPADREKQVFGEDAKEYQENWDTSEWDDIEVPSNIQTQKDENGDFKYDTPIYTNQTYPWANYETVEYHTNGQNRPVAPTVKNTVGQYKRTFTVPEDWDGRDVFVSFQGVESAFYLYINGQKVGYAEDSYTVDEFNITPYLKEGENTIAVEVYRWSTGSYLENQDFIRLSGIFRDVYLYSKDDVELRDFFVTTDLDEKYEDATLNLEASVRSLNPEVSGKYTIEAQLYEQEEEKAVWEEPLRFDIDVAAGKTTPQEKADDKGQTGSGSKLVENPKKWFADTPNLYRLLIQLKDENGNVIETACQRIGFREISKVDINEAGQEQAQINGQKLMIRGVNRHESDLQDGRAISREDIATDLKTMKQFNVNAIRTAHYPNNPYTYALADELGLYICDEANIESHKGSFEGGADIPSGESLWNNSVMDRTKNLVERDKNHASVIIWSLGNEATYSTHAMDENYCFYNSTTWILERDPSRLRKYERDNRYTKGNREESIVDIYSSQYWGVSSVESHVANTANKAPYIQSEYAHSMGNGLGNFKEYWDVFREYDNAQGGFIWDWIDQSIETKIENVTTYYVKNPDGSYSEVKGELTDGRENQGKALDGHVFIPQSDDLNANSDELTLAAWVRLDRLNGTDQAIISKGDNSYNLKISKAGNKIEFFVDGWSQGTLTADFPEDKLGQWIYLAGTYKDGKYTLYLDGEELASKDIQKSTPVDTSGYQIGIGGDPQYNGRGFQGLIDSVQVLRHAMTKEEVAKAYEDGFYEPGADELVYGMDFTADQTKEEGTDYREGTYFGYGGDWGETVTDNDFCGNGLMYADRTPSPELYEVKKVHQEVSFYDDGEAKDGKVRVVNEFLATSLSEYDITWKLLEDDQVLAEGALSEEQKNIAPYEQKEVVLEGFPEDLQVTGGSDYILEMSVALKEDQKWAGDYSGHAGDEIAFEQLELKDTADKAQPAIEVSDDAQIMAQEEENLYTVSGTQGEDTFTVVFDKATGYMTEYTVNGETLLTEGPKPNYFRARVSNDPNFTDAMRDAAENFEVAAFEVDEKEKVISIHVEGTISTLDSPNSMDYIIYANGDIVVTNTFTPAANEAVGEIARVGMKMTVPDKYQDVTYYGRGPHDNYIDRHTGSKIGVYRSTVEGMSEGAKFTRPQEYGNRTDVRWTALTEGTSGKGIMISAKDTMETSALHYDAADINQVWKNFGHPYQVPRTEDTIVTVDYAQRGLGNASCGPGPLAQYILNPGQTYTHTFRISPITAECDNEEEFVAKRMETGNQNVDSTMPVADIKIGGISLEGFTPSKTEYTCQILNKEELVMPKVEGVPVSEGTEVEVVQPTEENGYTATVKAVSPYGIEKTYTIVFEIKDEIYVSDMEWLVDESGYSANMRDQCTCGNGLGVWVDGVQTPFEKGVGSHAPSDVTFNVEGMDATTFKAVAGIGMEQSGNGNVNFIVKVDGKEVFRADGITFKTSVPVEVDITGAKTVSLVTETNGPDSNDHAVWADAKIVHKETAVEEKLRTAVLEYMIQLAEEMKEEGQLDGVILVVKERFEKALQNAKEILENTKNPDGNVTQAQIDKAVEELLKAAQYLEFKGDKQDLMKVLELAKDIAERKDNYIPSTYAVFEKEYETAGETAADENALQDEIDEAWRGLLEAMAGLRLIPDKSALEELVNKAETIELSLYTKESRERFEKAFAKASEVLDSTETTQEEVDESVKMLQASVDGLEKNAEKAASAGEQKSDQQKAGSMDAADKNAEKGNTATNAQKSAKTGDNGAAAPFVFALLALAGAVMAGKRKR